MATKQTHTVRTVSRRTSGGGGLNPSSGRVSANAFENKKTLFKRMLVVVGLVVALLGALMLVESLPKKNTENPPQPNSASAVTPNASPTVNLDNLEDVLNQQKAQNQQTELLEPEEPIPPPESPPAEAENNLPNQAPERTPFDDLNYVENPPTDSPQVEQRITETGETILKITPQKASQGPKNSDHSTEKNAAQRTMERLVKKLEMPAASDSLKITPEATESLPMQSSTAYAPPVESLEKKEEPVKTGRMPSHRFHVQAGIFLENARARALYQKILNAGIPAVMETRVQVGPFSTRKEAENAQKQLKKLGVDGIVVAPS